MNNIDDTFIINAAEILGDTVTGLSGGQVASFLHRELIEDSYINEVSHEDMCSINQQMVKRAKCYNSLLAFQTVHSLQAYREWDNPVITNGITDIMKHVDEELDEVT